MEKPDANQVWVFGTPSEKWKPECITPKKGQRSFRDGLGLLWRGNRETFCPFVVKSVNAGVYLKLLECLVLPVAQRINDTIGDAVFQQDNAPVLLHQFATEWFEQHNIQVDERPPYSPDLNPIEHVWTVFKQQLHKQHPDIADTPNGPDAVRVRLVEVLPKVWDSLPEQLPDNLYQSIQDRAAGAIDAKGWYTRR